MVRGDIVRRLVVLAGTLAGHFKAGLGQVEILASVIFGGMSGSATADASAVGGLMAPRMRERGHGVVYTLYVALFVCRTLRRHGFVEAPLA